MKGTLRKSMAWLHTWAGLSCGWLLCVIMLTGSLSVFRAPITRWMEAAPVVEASAQPVSALPVALDYLARHGQGARVWRVQLPARDGDAMQVTWRTTGIDHSALLHPQSGTELPAAQHRKTEGGRHFMSFHYMLQWQALGYWVVGWVSMGMLIALLGGVIIHRRLFQDFFTLRPGKGPRAWLDVHNASGVLALPFHLMIVYTGLAIFYSSYLPWPLQALYGTRDDAYAIYHAQQAPNLATPGLALSATNLAAQALEASAMLGQPLAMLVVFAPGSPEASAQVFGRRDERADEQRLLRPAGHLTFDLAHGTVSHLSSADATQLSQADRLHRTLEALHFADYGGWSLRWIYFGLGLLGTLMSASGLLLFTSKRRIKSGMEFANATPLAYRLIDALNIASISGMAVACVSYLYANRLLAADLADRANMEIRMFLLVWLLSLIHALTRRQRSAWIEQLWLGAGLCAGVPLLNALSTGQALPHYLLAGDWQRASVELVVLAFACLLGYSALHLQRIAPSTRAGRNAAPAKRSGAKRWQTAAHVLLATFGSYLLTALGMTALALGLTRSGHVESVIAVLSATLLGFAVCAASVLWVFSLRNAWVALLRLAGVAASLSVLIAWLS